MMRIKRRLVAMLRSLSLLTVPALPSSSSVADSVASPAPAATPAPAARQGRNAVCNICCSNGTDTAIPTGKVTAACNGERTICQSCLERHVGELLLKGAPQRVKCICTIEPCDSELAYEDIRKNVGSEVFQRYDATILRAYLEGNDEFCWCARRGCGSGQLHASEDRYPVMRCHTCEARTCFTHQCEWHSGRSCEQFDRDAAQSEEVALLQLLQSSKYQRCPKCNHGVEKNRGCDHMTCRCGHQFCWRCLAPYLGDKGINTSGNKAHNTTCKHYRRR